MKLFLRAFIIIAALAGFSQVSGQTIKTLAPKTLAPRRNLSSPSIASRLSASLAACAPAQAGGCALPVTLLSFEGQRMDINNVLLKWKTTDELNNAGFEVERSLGNTAHFEGIAWVKAQAAGSMVNSYTLPDPNSFAGTSYYRLKQVDIDSHFVYSKVIAIANEGQQESLTLYPNPAKSMLNAAIVSRNGGNSRIYLCDMQGRVMAQLSSAVQKGANLVQLPVSNLSNGMYVVRIFTAEGGTALMATFLKQ